MGFTESLCEKNTVRHKIIFDTTEKSKIFWAGFHFWRQSLFFFFNRWHGKNLKEFPQVYNYFQQQRNAVRETYELQDKIDWM